jgi:hypothetical protein
MMPTSRTPGPLRRKSLSTTVCGLLLIGGALASAFGQSGNGPLNLFQNYFVTGDYLVGGWVKGAPDGSGFAPGTISIPDTLQPPQPGVPASVPKGADIVAAYLFWATVEGNQSSYAGKQAYFDGYQITGTVLGNPNAPTSWSSGGCSGSSLGSKTMRTYRADVHPYLPVDTNPSSLTFGATIANGTFQVRLADSGSNGNGTPLALGATLVIIYRVLSPAVPLNAIVIYDGAFAPSNSSSTFSQSLVGFYEPTLAPVAKITQIVANGQPNKNEQVYLNNLQQPLPSIYGSLPPFPGVYGDWDNPTWVLNSYGNYVTNKDLSESTSVTPSSTNSGCVSWGTVILSTTVQDTDGDGLLDEWETNQGYADVVRGLDTNTPTGGQWVALPGANPNKKDIFIELDYLTNLDGSAGPYLHSHLPKEAAIDAVGDAFKTQNIGVHFDLGPGIYQGDPYVISYPVQIPNPLPLGTLAPQAGAGGNAISEGQLLCTGQTFLCAFPGQPAIGWKSGFEAIKNSSTLGNFQPGREKSYHYILFGHSLGAPRSYWSTVTNDLADPTIPQLLSIVNSGTTATVTLQSPAGLIKPGDCPDATIPGCSDANSDRISITGALGQTALNGSYQFSNIRSSTINGLTKTSFTITTTGVADGTYNYSDEPELAVAYLGPTSRSGQSEFGGGGDSVVTLGLWGADDAANCQNDPSQTLTSGQVYCNNEVGTLNVETGTLLHELGHSLALTHGGTYYRNVEYPSLPTYEPNCKPNYLSVMNYLFQVRGFVDGAFDYSNQTLSPLNEAFPLLSESAGVGTDTVTGQTAAHLTRWYSTPNALDQMQQSMSGGRFALSHCDGTPLGPNDVPEVRVDGTVAPGGTFSGPLDWNNDLTVPDAVNPPGVDLNYNGKTNDPAFTGYDDWQAINLQQIDARENAFGYSGGGVAWGGGGVAWGGGGVAWGGGGIDNDGGGVAWGGGGVAWGGGGVAWGGGGVDQNEDQATSTADAPTGLTCTIPISGIAGCSGSSGTYLENAKKVPLTWTAPVFGQTRVYTIWRAVGSYSTTAQVLANASAFSVLTTVTGAPPSPAYVDVNIKNNTTYTYFVTDSNKHGAQSAASAPLVVTIKF